jgi:hypothetical protein
MTSSESIPSPSLPPSLSLSIFLLSTDTFTSRFSFSLSRYLVNFLKSASEVKRIRKERQLAQEMEEREIKQAIEAQKYAQEAGKKHAAATRIANLYREKAARKYVREKKNQQKMEVITSSLERYRRAAMKIQKRFRVYSVRKYFVTKVGVKFRIDFTKKKKKQTVLRSDKEEARRLAIKKEAVRNRVEYDVQQRRFNQRNSMIFAIYSQYTHVLQVCSSSSRTLSLSFSLVLLIVVSLSPYLSFLRQLNPTLNTGSMK